ncbi:uncharacterized protein F4817DRAFT_326023 [Daldinia loculata]|uniref:uncharacterized protein n=1 Tax=Daldinia loculata TaxID=103429 RepID=UPI0020C4D064|nr:uncharacterized protein F4817DRAFT_326023 [Daldinia loculata]KAI1650867.1 hypothetical protein F4817DRAFT_326023 [Daldinia loculata]
MSSIVRHYYSDKWCFCIFLFYSHVCSMKLFIRLDSSFFYSMCFSLTSVYVLCFIALCFRFDSL